MLIGKKLKQRLQEYQDSAISGDSSNEQASLKDIHLPLTEHALDYMEMMLEELAVKKSTEGEELFYNLLWDQEYTIFDYISPRTFVLFYDYDRQVNAELAINREMSAMYRKIREIMRASSDVTSASESLQKSLWKIL